MTMAVVSSDAVHLAQCGMLTEHLMPLDAPVGRVFVAYRRGG